MSNVPVMMAHDDQVQALVQPSICTAYRSAHTWSGSWRTSMPWSQSHCRIWRRYGCDCQSLAAGPSRECLPQICLHISAPASPREIDIVSRHANRQRVEKFALTQVYKFGRPIGGFAQSSCLQQMQNGTLLLDQLPGCSLGRAQSDVPAACAAMTRHRRCWLASVAPCSPLFMPRRVYRVLIWAMVGLWCVWEVKNWHIAQSPSLGGCWTRSGSPRRFSSDH